MPVLDPERIYSTEGPVCSTQRLLEALSSSVVGLKDQLQVLSILDGSSSCWPGVSSAEADLEHLVQLTVKRAQQLDCNWQQLQAAKAQQDGQLASCEQSVKALERQRKDNAALQSQLQAQSVAAEAARQQQWELEKSRADLTAQLEKLSSDGQFMEGEVSGLKEQLAAQTQQLAALHEELAVKAAECSHTAAAVQENRDALAHCRQQLVATQEQHGSQLQAVQQLLHKAQEQHGSQLRQQQQELACVRLEKQQLLKESTRLQQEVSALAAALSSSQTDVARLKEWQDVVKRVADDRAVQAGAAAEAAAAAAAAQQAALAGEVLSLREQLAARELDAAALQRQLGLVAVQVREAQRVAAAAADAQAAAGATLEAQRREIDGLKQQLHESKLARERLSSEAAAAREAAGSQLAAAVREAAVSRAHAEGWQRDNKSLLDKLRQVEAQLQAAQQAAAQDQLARVAAAAAQESALRELQSQLSSVRSENARLGLQAASVASQYEHGLQRLRREAAAGAEEVRRLRLAHDTAATGALATATTAAAQLPAVHGSGRLSSAGSVCKGSDTGDLSPPLQQELSQLRMMMHAVSGNLQAADAAMQKVASANRSKQSSPASSSAAIRPPLMFPGPAAVAGSGSPADAQLAASQEATAEAPGLPTVAGASPAPATAAHPVQAQQTAQRRSAMTAAATAAASPLQPKPQPLPMKTASSERHGLLQSSVKKSAKAAGKAAAGAQAMARE